MAELNLKDRYKEIIGIIESEKIRALNDFEQEITKTLNELNEDLVEVLKLFIGWKVNYQNVLGGSYCKLANYIDCNALKLSLGKNIQDYESFFTVYKALGYGAIENKEAELALRQDVYDTIKAEKFYDSIGFLIDHVNKDGQISLKLPPIENFEIDVLQNLVEDINMHKASYTKLKEFCNSQEYKLEQRLKKEIEKSAQQHEALQDRNRQLKNQLDDLKYDNRHYEIQNSMMLKEFERKQYVPVAQFNELYWGDNYPALKVLFDFLQKMDMVDFSWSYFAYLMCVGNMEIFNLNSGQLNKADIGYLLYKLQGFFINEYSNSKEKYRVFLASKIFIDNTSIDESYFKKYFRGYNKGKNTLKDQSLIDDLCKNIADKYH